MRTSIVLVVMGLVGEMLGACAQPDNENDRIVACQAKGGAWVADGCSTGYCQLPSGAVASSWQGLGLDPDDHGDASASVGR